MWVAKIKYKHEDCITMPKVVKNKISAYATPGNSYSDEKFIYNTGFLVLNGNEKNKKAFINDMKKDKNVVKLSVNNDFIVFTEKRPSSKPEYSAFRSKEIMCVKPVYCNPDDGYEYWEICSWDKKHINNFLRDIEKIGQAQILSINKMKLDDIYYFHINPNLTSKQRQALEIAIRNDYYKVPRKIDLGQLAKEMKISRQAYSEHLRKAESKLMPKLTEDFLK